MFAAYCLLLTVRKLANHILALFHLLKVPDICIDHHIYQLAEFYCWFPFQLLLCL